MRISMIFALLCLLLSACGQRGALYLPDAGREAVVSTPAAEAAPATDETDTEEQRRQAAPGNDAN